MKIIYGKDPIMGLDERMKFVNTNPEISTEEHNYNSIEIITHTAKMVLMKVKDKLGEGIVYRPTDVESFERVGLKTNVTIFDLISQKIHEKAGKENG